ncbi:YihY/virulence factor BrkB family protein [Streptomyces sp. NPDC059477]|uniref:YihY/virulence factor BrkB family protein n=1 Tax=Streptomyces sp. NPDC059477 TaxID=3346847 RepID=UPI00368B045C
MDWLKRLPVVGPLVARLMTTHAWSSYERLDRVKWTRLAAAMTFISFIALFPLLTVVAAVAALALSTGQRAELEEKIADQVPGISDQLDIGGLVDNAGTVGLIAGAVLLFTGIGWVSSVRGCLRAVWELPDPEENPFLRKAKDAGVLFGLGGALLVTLAASTVASALVDWIVRHLGIEEGGWGSVLLRTAAFAVAVLTDFLILLYVLTLLPGVEPRRRRLIEAALIGAVGFELLKLLLSGYIQGVAAKSMYGAFGVPVALLLWINFTAKLILFCAAWTATRNGEAEAVEGAEGAEGAEAETDEAQEVDGPGESGESGTRVRPGGAAGAGGPVRGEPSEGAERAEGPAGPGDRAEPEGQREPEGLERQEGRGSEGAGGAKGE